MIQIQNRIWFCHNENSICLSHSLSKQTFFLLKNIIAIISYNLEKKFFFSICLKLKRDFNLFDSIPLYSLNDPTPRHLNKISIIL